MEGIPIRVQEAADKVLEIEGVGAVKVVPPEGLYTIHACLANQTLANVEEFYKKVFALNLLDGGCVNIQSESEESYQWINGMVLGEDDAGGSEGGSADLEVPSNETTPDVGKGTSGGHVGSGDHEDRDVPGEGDKDTV